MAGAASFWCGREQAGCRHQPRDVRSRTARRRRDRRVAVDEVHLHAHVLGEVVREADERILQQAREQGVREPFSLLFSGPLEPFLEQHMYTLHHDELGIVEMFLVPVKQDENSYYYEAVFG